MGVHQSFPSMILVSLGFGSTVFMEASSMTQKNTSAGIGVLRAMAFARSLALMFLFLSMYSTVKPMK
jgi:hypothetical protein